MGSEMCIRDRPGRVRGAVARRPRRAVRRRSRVLGNRSSWRSVSGCLLYTSDAADERSSVDLGGRRIIKKKKHVVQSD